MWPFMLEMCNADAPSLWVGVRRKKTSSGILSTSGKRNWKAHTVKCVVIGNQRFKT